MPQSNRMQYSPPADDWETRALRGIAARMDELPSTPAEADDFGWEEGVLEKLRERLNATD